MTTRYNVGDRVRANGDVVGEVVDIKEPKSDSPDYVVQFPADRKQLKASNLEKVDIDDREIKKGEVTEGTILMDNDGVSYQVGSTDDDGFYASPENSKNSYRISWDELNQRFANTA